MEFIRGIDLLNFYERLHHETIEHSRELRFDIRDEYHRLLIFNHSSALELHSAALMLAARHLWIGFAPILRSIFELHVDLLNLLHDPEYIRKLEVEHHRNWIKTLKSAMDGNSFLALIGQSPDIDQHLQYRNKNLS